MLRMLSRCTSYLASGLHFHLTSGGVESFAELNYILKKID